MSLRSRFCRRAEGLPWLQVFADVVVRGPVQGVPDLVKIVLMSPTLIVNSKAVKQAWSGTSAVDFRGVFPVRACERSCSWQTSVSATVPR